MATLYDKFDPFFYPGYGEPTKSGDTIKEGDMLKNILTGNSFKASAFQAEYYNRKKFGFIKKVFVTEYEYIKALMIKIMFDKGKPYTYGQCIEIINTYESQNK